MILHWLVGPHPWAQRHPRGLLWLLILVGWVVDAILWFGATAAWVVDTCDQPHHKDCNAISGLLPGTGSFVAFGMLIATFAMVWQAEERRLNRAKAAEIHRETRAERITRLEKETGISA